MPPPSQVALLIPLHNNNKNVVELPVLEGDNIIGRNNVPVNDKRLSRKHLTLSVSTDDANHAHLHVEGLNPVVITSGDKRTILSSGEKGIIKSGDIIELIPGSHHFKYVTLKNDERKSSTAKRVVGGDTDMALTAAKKARAGGTYAGEGEGLSVIRQNVNGNSGANHKVSGSGNSDDEAIRGFRLSDDKLASSFRLMKVKGLPEWANTSCVSLDDVIKGDVLLAVLSNYMVDLDWLLSACPTLKRVPQVLVIHGEGDGTVEYMKRNKPSNWILHKPPLPISYGTHHSKAMLLVYPRGVRVIVHTANLIYVDWNNKTQGLWMQDFPWKTKDEASKGSEFEQDLVAYLQALKLPGFTAELRGLGSFRVDASFFKKFNYENAMVRLIASVPGYHSGPNLKKWGHMKLRSILDGCTFDDEFKKSALIYQFSSLGSLDEKWMAELRSSMSAGSSTDKTPLGLGEPLIIWPTVEDVRWSLEGYAAGNAIPSPLKNVEKEFLKKYWAKWKATPTGRCRAMPHIKTFVRYKGQDLAWFLLTSANLSKAAWGALQKNSSQLMIRSYELGVLLLPTTFREGCGFSCTDDVSSSKDKNGSVDCIARKTKLVSLKGTVGPDPNREIICLPLPYELPPKPYSSEDVPWSWDREYRQKDAYGQVWPRQVKLYTSQDS